MASATRAAVIFLFLLAGAEAERIQSTAAFAVSQRKVIEAHGFAHSESAEELDLEALAAGKQPDLDWPGCGKKVGRIFGKGCDEIPGCARQKVWLDTPRQSCRFTDAHKLEPSNVPTFLPVELARLEEKSTTFARKGCLLGGWLFKCYRRMRQQLRLLKYVRRAVQDAKSDPSHPAYGLATAPETQAALNRIADNFAEGFRKHEARGADGADYPEAYDAMKKMPETLRGAAKRAEGSENRSLTEQERDASENTATVEAMLKVVQVDLTDEQRADLYGQIEAAGPMSESEDALDEDVESLADDLDEAIEAADAEDRDSVKDNEAGTAEDETDDPEDLVARREDAGSLVELWGGSNDSRQLQQQGGGPLKWLWKNGVGMIVKRIAWLILFLVASAIGIIRAGVIFPLLFVACTVAKFMVWLFKDAIYRAGWQGNTTNVTSNFKRIGKCAPWMWGAVGFDTSSVKNGSSDAFRAVVVKPTKFASGLTGVHHLWKSNKQLCKKVRCGANTECEAGRCLCRKGFFPDESSPGHCRGALTGAGCRCEPRWTSGSIFKTTHYGCASNRCQVDRQDPSYESCQQNLSSKLFGGKSAMDNCSKGEFRAEVPSLPQGVDDPGAPAYSYNFSDSEGGRRRRRRRRRRKESEKN